MKNILPANSFLKAVKVSKTTALFIQLCVCLAPPTSLIYTITLISVLLKKSLCIFFLKSAFQYQRSDEVPMRNSPYTDIYLLKPSSLTRIKWRTNRNASSKGKNKAIFSDCFYLAWRLECLHSYFWYIWPCLLYTLLLNAACILFWV